MATVGRKQVGPGQVIQSAQWGNPLWDQSVQCFTSAADRTQQYPAPHEGAVSWLDDVKRLEQFKAGAWRALGVVPVNVVGAPLSPVQLMIASDFSVNANASGQFSIDLSATFSSILAASITKTGEPCGFGILDRTPATTTFLGRNMTGGLLTGAFRIDALIYGMAK